MIAFALFFQGCASDRTEPPWRSDAENYLQRFEEAYLKGRISDSEKDFQKALAELSASGEIVQVSRAWLYRCALETASLDFGPCKEYSDLAARESDPAQQAYFRFLQGNWQDLDTRLLPQRYRRVATAEDANEVNREIAAISAPASRLVATGAAVMARRFDNESLQSAAATASAWGWRRPLLAYLMLQRSLARKNGDTETVRKLSDRIELVGSPDTARKTAKPYIQ